MPLAGQRKVDAAIGEFTAVTAYFPGAEATCRYGVFLKSIGRDAEARAQFQKIVKTVETSPPHVKRLNKQWYQVAKAEGAGL